MLSMPMSMKAAEYRLLTSAKVNLGLTVIGRLSDGYHEIESIFLPVGVFDRIFCEFRVGGHEKRLRVFGRGLGVEGLVVPEDERNIVWRVVKFVEDSVGVNIGFGIEVEKNIPVGAGLGGGSGNGAGVLLALTDFLKKEGFLSEEERRKVLSEAYKVGSDISFFLSSGGCVVQGRGEKVMKVEGLFERLKGYIVVIVYPNLMVSTKEAYEFVSRENLYSSKRWALEVANGLASGRISVEDLKGILKNTFEAFIIDPVVMETKKQLYGMGAKFALMSGSGSSVYGVFDQKVSTEKILERLVGEFNFSVDQIFFTRFVENPVQFI